MYHIEAPKQSQLSQQQVIQELSLAPLVILRYFIQLSRRYNILRPSQTTVGYHAQVTRQWANMSIKQLNDAGLLYFESYANKHATNRYWIPEELKCPSIYQLIQNRIKKLLRIGLPKKTPKHQPKRQLTLLDLKEFILCISGGVKESLFTRAPARGEKVMSKQNDLFPGLYLTQGQLEDLQSEFSTNALAYVKTKLHHLKDPNNPMAWIRHVARGFVSQTTKTPTPSAKAEHKTLSKRPMLTVLATDLNDPNPYGRSRCGGNCKCRGMLSNVDLFPVPGWNSANRKDGMQGSCTKRCLCTGVGMPPTLEALAVQINANHILNDFLKIITSTGKKHD